MENGKHDSKAMASSDFALSLSIFYDTNENAMVGSSAGESQIITLLVPSHFKHSGGLKVVGTEVIWR